MQEGRIEIIADLREMVHELLSKFADRHGAYDLVLSLMLAGGMKPQRVLFYRDGASEGQFKEIGTSTILPMALLTSAVEKEVRAIKEACQQLEAGYAPPITFVVAAKVRDRAICRKLTL